MDENMTYSNHAEKKSTPPGNSPIQEVTEAHGPATVNVASAMNMRTEKEQRLSIPSSEPFHSAIVRSTDLSHYLPPASIAIFCIRKPKPWFRKRKKSAKASWRGNLSSLAFVSASVSDMFGALLFCAPPHTLSPP